MLHQQIKIEILLMKLILQMIRIILMTIKNTAKDCRVRTHTHTHTHTHTLTHTHTHTNTITRW